MDAVSEQDAKAMEAYRHAYMDHCGDHAESKIAGLKAAAPYLQTPRPQIDQGVVEQMRAFVKKSPLHHAADCRYMLTPVPECDCGKWDIEAILAPPEPPKLEQRVDEWIKDHSFALTNAGSISMRESLLALVTRHTQEGS